MGIFIAVFFLLGIVIGSFLNVCITRIPEGLSIVSPGSRCPRCLVPIKAYDNVPIFGWFWLRGKCRSCSLPISPMYPLIELLSGLLFVACFLRFGFTAYTAKWILFCALMVVLSVIDLRARILPDAITVPGALIGLLVSSLLPPLDGSAFLLAFRVAHRIPPEHVLGLLDGVLGAALGSLLLWGAAALYRVIRGREGMGMGDVKMMLLVGAFLGVRGTFFTILLGTFLGSIIGLVVVTSIYLSGWKAPLAARANRRGLGPVRNLRWTVASRYQLPLGTFLGIAAIVVVFALMPVGYYLGIRQLH